MAGSVVHPVLAADGDDSCADKRRRGPACRQKSPAKLAGPNCGVQCFPDHSVLGTRRLGSAKSAVDRVFYVVASVRRNDNRLLNPARSVCAAWL
jgi:hypothetical protein